MTTMRRWRGSCRDLVLTGLAPECSDRPRGDRSPSGKTHRPVFSTAPGALPAQRYTLPVLLVYGTLMSRTRTNVEIDDGALQVVMRRYRLATKTEAIDLALRRLAGQPMSREEALAMRGAAALDEVPAEAALGP